MFGFGPRDGDGDGADVDVAHVTGIHFSRRATTGWGEVGRIAENRKHAETSQTGD